MTAGRARWRACATPGCGRLVPAGQHLCRGPGSCAERAEAGRGTPADRGYGPQHRALRRRLARLVAKGGVACARCGLPIEPGAPWALDHTDGREGYLGASHETCNAADGGRKALAARR